MTAPRPVSLSALDLGPHEGVLLRLAGHLALQLTGGTAQNIPARLGRMGCLIGGALGLFLLALLILARALWLPLFGGFLIVADPLQPADAVAPLGGGGRERVIQAAALVRQGVASWLIATDSQVDLPGLRDSWADLTWPEAIWQGTPEARIVAAPGIVTTTEEAQALRRLALERGWRSLIVITAL